MEQYIEYLRIRLIEALCVGDYTRAENLAWAIRMALQGLVEWPTRSWGK